MKCLVLIGRKGFGLSSGGIDYFSLDEFVNFLNKWINGEKETRDKYEDAIWVIKKDNDNYFESEEMCVKDFKDHIDDIDNFVDTFKFKRIKSVPTSLKKYLV